MAGCVGSRQETQKKSAPMLFLDLPRPAGIAEFRRVWEAEALGEGLQPLGNSRLPHTG